MAGISSLGVGSGVLTSDLVDKLVAAERAPADNRFTRKTQQSEAMLSAYGKLRSAITELRLPMRQLSSADNLKAFSASSSNEDIGVSVDSAKASRGSYSLDVTSLATAQALKSTEVFADRDTTAVGEGKLTIAVGDKTADITIDNSNNSLQGLANAINDSGVGVSAGVIDTGNGFQLVLSSDETGTANAVSITATDNNGTALTDGLGLSRFDFNTGVDDGAGLSQTIAATDAKMDINGITVTRPSNSFENVIDGLSFDIKDIGKSTVKVSQDVGAVTDRVQGFVDKFNALQGTIDSLAGFNSDAGVGSLLTGDSTVRALQSQLRQVLTSVVPGLENASVRSLVDVGISTDPKTGALEFNRSIFETQLKENPDDVTALFAEQGRTTDGQVEFVRSGLKTQPGRYDINVTQAATQGKLMAGSALATDGIKINGDNDELTLELNGETKVDLKLTQGETISPQDLVSDIQAQLDSNAALKASGESVQVALDDSGKLTFTSGKYGSESSVSVSSQEGTDVLGLTGAGGTAGQDIAGTIGGRTAKGDGQVLFLSSDSGPASGLQVRILGDQTGDRGSINFVQGIGKSTVDLVTRFVGADGDLDSRTNSLNRELEEIQQDRVKLEVRIESYRERLVKQFSAADSLISQLNSTRDFVTQQLEALAPQNFNK